MAENDKPKDPEIEKLEKEKQIAELEATIATKKKETLAATFPSSVTPVEAKTEIDEKAVIEAYILAYDSLDRAAEKIVTKVLPLIGNNGLLIHNPTDLAALGTYRAFVGQMAELGAEYDAIKLPVQNEAVGALAAIVGVTAAAKSVIDLLSLFRTQTTIKGVDVVIDDLPLISEVAGRFAARGKQVYVSQIYPLDLDPSMSAEIQRLLAGVRRKASEAAQRIAALPDDSVEKKRLKAADAIRVGYEDLLTKVATAEAPLLSKLLLGAAVEKVLQTAQLLYLKVLKANGTNEATKNILGSNVQHSGGVIVNFMLFEKNGTVKLAATEIAYSGELKNVPKI
ncbi:MAG TPA: hypothetical protein VHW00_17035 [Thermoanaerobaculia bacterium]|nr:hypothetical protein [Thermoanaerobaculia bacterium]